MRLLKSISGYTVGFEQANNRCFYSDNDSKLLALENIITVYL